MEGTENKTWKRIGLVAGPAVLLALAFIPSGLHHIEGKGHRPAYAAGVAALMAIWWFTEAVPIAWTALVPLVLFPLFGVYGKGLGGDAVKSAEPFVDAYIFLFMGGMALGAAMEQWNLHRRIALHIMRAIGTDPRRLLLGMIVATAAISLWISNTATAVMMVPIAMALLRQLEAASGGKKLAHFGSAVMLAVAYGANVGGIGTKIGTPTNSLFAGFVAKEPFSYDLGFLQFIGIGLPFVVIFIPIIWWMLWRLARHDTLQTHTAPDVIRGELRAMGSMSRGERIVAVVFGSAAALWMLGDPIRKVITPLVPTFYEGFKFGGKHYEATVAITAALVLIALRSLSWAAIKKVPWDTLLLLGGSFAMAAGIEGSGLSDWMAARLAAVETLPLVAQMALTALATIALSAIASNTATLNVMLNVLPRSLPLLGTSALAASCDFALPAGTPPNAIVFGSGYIRLPTMMKTGITLDLMAALLLTLYGWLYLPFLF